MSCIARAGRDYGLCFYSRKAEALPIRCSFRVLKPDACPIARKSSMICLRSLLDGCGGTGSQLNHRLGSARAAFKTCAQVWKHARTSQQHKVRIFEACIGSQPLYCLHTDYKACSKILLYRQLQLIRGIALLPPTDVMRTGVFLEGSSFPSRVHDKPICKGQPKQVCKITSSLYRWLVAMKGWQILCRLHQLRGGTESALFVLGLP